MTTLDRLASLTPADIPLGLVVGEHSGKATVTDPERLLASLRADLARGHDTAQGRAAMGRAEALVRALDLAAQRAAER